MFKLSVIVYTVTFVCLGTLGLVEGEEKPLTSKDTFRLHSGDLMPYIGFGTSRITGDDIILKVLDYALAAGYRLFDTAQAYKNEESVGKALKVLLPKYNLTRKDIFITTKLKSDYLGDDDVYRRMEESIKTLQCEYIDLFLIHFPGRSRHVNLPNPKNDSVLRDETWQIFVKAVKQGLTKNIGVSNYNVRHLKELLRNDHGIKPAVNQVEWHPKYHQPELLEFCRKEGILLQAYFSLGGTGRTDTLFNQPDVVNIANKLNKTPAQILLRWSLQQKIATIPKSTSEAHIKSNRDLDFTIPEEDMKTLSNLEQKRFGSDTNTIL